MMIVVGYDVALSENDGAKRLRRVAKICTEYGQRVQFSLFECVVDQLHYLELKDRLTKVIDPERDSLRFYRLGKNYQSKIEHIGVKSIIDVGKPIIM
ncbi:CRISPR-associated endonuclease Cas2 [Lacticaseibacillus zhaodongensis]|uniref:CRISPR-associated endonuclease Cas2 n=1 Tax=Lacticaseibacillus zhaodongensis TaxID=2668065 RepID=UPI0012D30CD4|nr:CRISPR-associated endonuclease Cas2 [Lacticaseibacillus zhaodongensis]